MLTRSAVAKHVVHLEQLRALDQSALRVATALLDAVDRDPMTAGPSGAVYWVTCPQGFVDWSEKTLGAAARLVTLINKFHSKRIGVSFCLHTLAGTRVLCYLQDVALDRTALEGALEADVQLSEEAGSIDPEFGEIFEETLYAIAEPV